MDDPATRPLSPEQAKAALRETAQRASLLQQVREHPRQALLTAFVTGLVLGLGDRRDRLAPLIAEALLRFGLEEDASGSSG